ncbi:hypothetical protein BGX26_008248, partial [Mortierella sp. AD094]
MRYAQTVDEVDEAHHIRKANRDNLRNFENSNTRKKEQRTQRLRNERAYQKLGAAERRFVQNSAEKANEVDLPAQQPQTPTPAVELAPAPAPSIVMSATSAIQLAAD